MCYAVVGAAAAMGAPLGWLLLRWSAAPNPPGIAEELTAHAGLYAYLLVGTMTAFSLFGALTGRLADRMAELNERLSTLSVTDGLTSLANRRAFNEMLTRECERTTRNGVPFALVMADLDHFKALNDRYGHQSGDAALVHAARLLAAGLRSQDRAFRIGGEEFAAICPGATAEEAAQVAERLRGALETTPLPLRDELVRVTASFGVADSRAEKDPERLFRRADRALYIAKSEGRNRTALAPDEQGAAAPGLNRS